MSKDIFYILSLSNVEDQLLKNIFIQDESFFFLGDLFSNIFNEILGKDPNIVKKESILEYEIERKYKSIFRKLENNFIEKKYFLEKGYIFPNDLNPKYRNFKGLLFHLRYNPQNLKVIFIETDEKCIIKKIIKKEIDKTINIFLKFWYRCFINYFIKKFFLKRKISIIKNFLIDNNIQYIQLNLDNNDLIFKNDLDFLEIFLKKNN